MSWLSRFMMGRNGSDQLAMALLLVSVILTFTGNVAKLNALTYLSYIPMILCLYRMFSKNINKRRMENYKFVTLMSPVYAFARKKLNMLKDSKTHRFFKCPKCNAQLRLPKGKGKISITCPVCKSQFVKKT